MSDIVLRIEKLHHQFGANHVLHDVKLEIGRGQIVSLVGPSGCGKSTLLSTVIGTRIPTSGNVLVDTATEGTELQKVKGPGRERGIVYQRYGLFPFLTAVQNVAIGPKLDETSFFQRIVGYPSWRRRRAKHMEEAAALLERVGLGDAIHRYPNGLSGGMRQRGAIAQALIMKPQILLLDEPFGALDEATREDLQHMLLTFYQENREALSRGEEPPYTILIVTHELNEAIYVGDRVLGLSQYWDWKSAGHAQCPGATIVYDKPCPVYDPGDVKLFEHFVGQRKEIREVVFQPSVPQIPGEHLSFWSDIKSGDARGITSDSSGSDVAP